MNLTKPKLEMPANGGNTLSQMLEAFQEAAKESGDEHFSWLMGDMSRKAKEYEEFIEASPAPDYEGSPSEARIDELEYQVSELEGQIEALDRQVDELESTETEAKEHIDSLNSQIEDLEDQLSRGTGNES